MCVCVRKTEINKWVLISAEHLIPFATPKHPHEMCTAQITRKSTTSQRKHCYTTESICFLVKNKRPTLARITMKENFQKILVPSCLGFMLFFLSFFYTKQARQNTTESNIVKLTVRSTITLCGEQNKLTAPLQSEITARQPPTVMSGRKAT